ncbi:hypothetical protein C2G38_2202591 [Gigaspora rosea]|uniref:Uncharacterized protein n=1 Tax=Gigaspora rosea TaxID=44941 RepID=A0A397UNP5_9GLOM|nr:hypothetical protein C2G38_2202591 [Gigaspora rosea]
MDLTFNSTIIFNNTEINGQKAASSDTDHKVLLSGISNETKINNRKAQQKIAVPWVVTHLVLYLLLEASNSLNPFDNSEPYSELAVKGNDMESFHFLSGGPYVINQHHEGKFVEEYPAKDEYENYRQLNIIARAILILKDLVNIWKEIGYYDIVNDVNDHVIQGALLLLFPPIPPKDYVMPTVKEIVNYLQKLIDLGFDLTAIVILDILQLFENKLNNIGERIIQAFISVRKNEKRDELFKKIVGETIKLFG